VLCALLLLGLLRLRVGGGRVRVLRRRRFRRGLPNRLPEPVAVARADRGRSRGCWATLCRLGRSIVVVHGLAAALAARLGVRVLSGYSGIGVGFIVILCDAIRIDEFAQVHDVLEQRHRERAHASGFEPVLVLGLAPQANGLFVHDGLAGIVAEFAEDVLVAALVADDGDARAVGGARAVGTPPLLQLAVGIRARADGRIAQVRNTVRKAPLVRLPGVVHRLHHPAGAP